MVFFTVWNSSEWLRLLYHQLWKVVLWDWVHDEFSRSAQNSCYPISSRHCNRFLKIKQAIKDKRRGKLSIKIVLIHNNAVAKKTSWKELYGKYSKLLISLHATPYFQPLKKVAERSTVHLWQRSVEKFIGKQPVNFYSEAICSLITRILHGSWCTRHEPISQLETRLKLDKNNLSTQNLTWNRGERKLFHVLYNYGK